MKSNESGMALITALLVVMLVSGADGRHVRGADRRPAVARDRPRPEPGLRRGPRRAREADLRASARCSTTDFSPSAAQIGADRQHPAGDPGLRVHVAGRRRRIGLSDLLHAGPGPAATPATRWPTAPTSRPDLHGLQGPDHALHLTVTAGLDRRLGSAAAPRAADGGGAGVPVRHLRRERPRRSTPAPTSTSAAACTPTATCTWRRAPAPR